MRIELCIGIGMMQSVHKRIHFRTQVRRALHHPGEEEEELLGPLDNCKATLRSIGVVKERLGEQRQVPVGNEEEENYQDEDDFRVRVQLRRYAEAL